MKLKRHFGAGRLKQYGSVQYDLELYDLRMVDYYTDKYGLWLDFRSTDDNMLHGTGRRIENASEGISFSYHKEDCGTDGNLHCYIYLFIDAQINISNGEFMNVMY